MTALTIRLSNSVRQLMASAAAQKMVPVPGDEITKVTRK